MQHREPSGIARYGHLAPVGAAGTLGNQRRKRQHVVAFVDVVANDADAAAAQARVGRLGHRQGKVHGRDRIRRGPAGRQNVTPDEGGLRIVGDDTAQETAHEAGLAQLLGVFFLLLIAERIGDPPRTAGDQPCAKRNGHYRHGELTGPRSVTTFIGPGNRRECVPTGADCFEKPHL